MSVHPPALHLHRSNLAVPATVIFEGRLKCKHMEGNKVEGTLRRHHVGPKEYAKIPCQEEAWPARRKSEDSSDLESQGQWHFCAESTGSLEFIVIAKFFKIYIFSNKLNYSFCDIQTEFHYPQFAPYIQGLFA